MTRKSFRGLVAATEGPLILPGAHDALAARLIARAGFSGFFIGGFGMVGARYGAPDIGLKSLGELSLAVRDILAACELPVLVDADDGYGDVKNVVQTVHTYERLGVGGLFLEDQRWPKRCGHMRGKEVIPAEEHAAKIRAAVDARGDTPFVITARTDALETDGLDEAIRRALLYKEAGATLLFVEGPRTKQELRRIGAELPPPLVVNLIEGGRTPLCSLEELAEMGFFSVGFVLSGLYAAARALDETYREILRAGSTTALRDRMLGFEEFNALVGVEQRFAEDERYRA